MLHEEIVCDDVDRSVLSAALGIVDACAASEIRDSALCGHTCSAKEHDVFGLIDQLLELLDLVLSNTSESVNPSFHYLNLNQ